METEIRKRSPTVQDDRIIENEVDSFSEDDKNIDLSKTIPSGTNKMPHILESTLSKLPDRWRNWTIRFLSTFLLVTTFGFIIWGGPVAFIVATLVVQMKCYAEVINIGYTVYRIHGLPWFRSLSWYFLATSNYFFYGESLMDKFRIVVDRFVFLRWMVNYHRFISFSMYIAGFIWFVLSLVNKYYMKQFSLFAWTHVALMMVVLQSYFIINNIFEGLIWFIVPVSMIVINDVWAYIFGFFFGRTPLIRVSPKKTWEGFIGGGVATILFGLVVKRVCKISPEMSYWLCGYSYMYCPILYKESVNGSVVGLVVSECEPSPLFRLQEYQLPAFLASPLQMIRLKTTFSMYPFVFHSFSLAVFSSFIGPFGGFFASGFKRAFKIKDFGDVIPGHGGVMDRFDCQFLMASFVHVYMSSFIHTPSVERLLQQVFNLKPDQQLQLFYDLRDVLTNRGILNDG